MACCSSLGCGRRQLIIPVVVHYVWCVFGQSKSNQYFINACLESFLTNMKSDGVKSTLQAQKSDIGRVSFHFNVFPEVLFKIKFSHGGYSVTIVGGYHSINGWIDGGTCSY